MTWHLPSRRGRFVVLAGMLAAGIAAVTACGGNGNSPTPGTWITMSTQVNGTTGRAFHAAVTLDSGDFLLVGGQDGDGTPLFGTQYAERFRLGTLGFDRESTFDTYAAGLFRIAPVAALVPDDPAAPFPTLDDVVIVGGQLDGGAGFATATTTVPAKAVWLDPAGTPTGDGEYYMGDPGTSPPLLAETNDLVSTTTPVFIQGAALVTDPVNGVVYMIGGRDLAGNALADIRWYDSAAGSSGGGAFVGTGTSLATPRYGHTATWTSLGTIVVAGGWDNLGQPTASVEVINTGTGPGTLTMLPSQTLEVPRAAHTATLTSGDNVVLLFGGVSVSDALAGAASGHTAEEIDPTGQFVTAWTATPRVYHTATAINTFDVLIAGGLESDGGSGFVASARADIVDTTSLIPTIRATGSLSTPRFGHTATQIAGGTVVVAGGLSGWSSSAGSLPAINSAERYFPERY